MLQVLEVLDAAALRHWCLAGLEALTAARQEIDDLNVFPVPDGDTGTNLQLTMAATVTAVGHAPHDLEATVTAMVTGSLLGARGSSGVILAQLLRGLGDVLRHAPAGAEQLRAALVLSAESAYGAVATPVEGTLLTVARAAAAAAQGDDVATVVRSARLAAAVALARTPDQLPALRAAGVVDAGGRGWCVLLEALERVVTGQVEQVPSPHRHVVPRGRSGLDVAREAGSEAFAYEVQYLLRETDDAAVVGLRAALGLLGDSLVVVGGDGLFNVHVHVNDVGAAIEAGLDAGRPFRISVTRFADQIDGEPPGICGRVVVAVASGAGLVAAFEEQGAVVVDGGPTSNPSTAELLAAAGGAREVVLLPNDSNVIGVATAAAEELRRRGQSAAVVPTRSVVQGLAALCVGDLERPFEDDVAARAVAACATRWAEVTTAVRAAETSAGPCRPGDVLGLLEGAVALVGQGVEAVAHVLLARLLASGGELVTVVLGARADAGLGERLQAWLSDRDPMLEVMVLRGDQPHYPLLLGVE